MANTLETSFLAAQKEMKAVVKDASNPFFKSKYASYDAVVETVKAPLNKHGLSFRHTSRWADNIMFVGSQLIHAETGVSSLPFEMPIKIGNAQETGSALSYAKRYTLSAIVGLPADDDDDANGATGKKAEPSEAPRQYAPTPHKKHLPGEFPLKGPATEKQVNFLRSEATRRGWLDTELNRAAMIIGKAETIEKLSKESMSILINKIKDGGSPAEFFAQFEPDRPDDFVDQIPFK